MIKEHIQLAITLAEDAMKKNEIPVGCVIADQNNKLVSFASNSTIKNHDPLGHAEIIAIRKACKKLKTTKLFNYSIYITLEPCQMCIAAIVNTGIKKVYFGAHSEGLAIHKSKLSNYFSKNKDLEFIGGFEEEYCSNLVKEFFKKKR